MGNGRGVEEGDELVAVNATVTGSSFSTVAAMIERLDNPRTPARRKALTEDHEAAPFGIAAPFTDVFSSSASAGSLQQQQQQTTTATTTTTTTTTTTATTTSPA